MIFSTENQSGLLSLCYLYFAPENPEDGKMYLLVLAHPGCPGKSPESHKMVVVAVVAVVKLPLKGTKLTAHISAGRSFGSLPVRFCNFSFSFASAFCSFFASTLKMNIKNYDMQ